MNQYALSFSLIHQFVGYLKQKNSFHDEQYQLAMLRALNVLEQVQAVTRDPDNIKNIISTKLDLLAHYVRDYNAGGAAALIKKDLLMSVGSPHCRLITVRIGSMVVILILIATLLALGRFLFCGILNHLQVLMKRCWQKIRKTTEKP